MRDGPFLYGEYPRNPCACCASALSQPRHFVTAPFRGKPAPAVPPPGVSAAHSLRKLAAAPPRRSCGPCGSRFPTLRCKVPRPRRCSDEHFLVKPFGGGLVQGISPDPCACCTSAHSPPQSLRDSPFQGQAGSGDASAGRLRCSFASQTRYRSAAPLVWLPPGVAFRLCVAKSRDRTGALG